MTSVQVRAQSRNHQWTFCLPFQEQSLLELLEFPQLAVPEVKKRDEKSPGVPVLNSEAAQLSNFNLVR